MADKVQLARQELARRELARRQQQPKPVESIQSQGMSYVSEHPFKTAFEPITKTVTGRSLQERSQATPISAKMTGNRILDPLRAGVAGMGAYGQDVMAMGADMLSTPANLIGGAASALKPVQAAGKAIAGSKVGKAVGGVLNYPLENIGKNIAKNIAPDNKIFNLYNYAVGGKIKNVGDVSKIKADRVNALRTISDNLDNIQIQNIQTGEVVSKIPENRFELLQALKQTKTAVWNKVSELSKGATSKGANINLSKIAKEALDDTKKQLGRVALKSNPKLVKSLDQAYNNIKSTGTIFPTEAENYMKFLNGEVQRLRQSGQAVDFSVKDLYSNLLGKLNDATDDVIEKTLEQAGYRAQRQQYSALKTAEKEILSAANKFLRQEGGQGGGIVHPIVNLWSIEEVLQGAVTGQPQKIVQAGLIKSASKIVDFMKNPDRRISQIFKLLKQQSVPK